MRKWTQKTNQPQGSGAKWPALMVAVSLIGLLSLAMPARAQGGWSYLAPLPTARYQMKCTLGKDGRIYVIGGEDNSQNILSTMEAYSPAAGSWSELASLPTQTYALACATDQAGLIYALGGASTAGPGIAATTAVEIYNLSNDSWTAGAAMEQAREDFAAVTGPDGRIYAIGGDNAYLEAVSSSVEAYNPATKTWTEVAPMNTARFGHAAALGPDGRIYAFGGFDQNLNLLSSVEAYNPSTNTWSYVASLNVARVYCAAAAGGDGRIYAIGGANDTYSGTDLTAVESYSVTTNTWTVVPSMNTARSLFAATAGADGNLYAFGGWDDTTLDTVETYAPPVAPTLSSFTPNAGFATASGVTGTSVTITGAHLANASSVTFNGTPATITSDIATQIVATVPAGATTGPIAVTTPGGTATSTTNFTVVTLQSVTFSSSPTCPGLNTTVTLTLSAPAPQAVTVTTSSSNSTVFPVPATFAIAAGKQALTLVKEAPGDVTASTPVTVSATLGSTTVSGTMNVVPWVSSVSVSPSNVVAGGSATMTINLAVPAPTGGEVVNVSSSNSDASPTDASGNPLKTITVPAGASSATINITTYTSAGSHTAVLSAGNHGATQSCTLSIAAGSLKLSVSPTSGIGGIATTFGFITLGAAAPPQGTVVTLSSSSAAALVLASVTVPAGSKSGSFPITTSFVSSATSAVISATSGTVTSNATLTLQPITVSSLILYPSILEGGDNAIGMVTISAAMPSPVTVTLTSPNASVVQVPQTVTIPAGATAAVFSISTTAVTANTPVVITAALNGSSQKSTLTVEP